MIHDFSSHDFPFSKELPSHFIAQFFPLSDPFKVSQRHDAFSWRSGIVPVPILYIGGETSPDPLYPNQILCNATISLLFVAGGFFFFS